MHHGRELPLRAAGAQEEREPDGSPSSCESPPPPLGRAARVKISDAFHLPPNCHCGRQGTGCYPRRVRLHGTRPGRRLHANSKHKPYIASTSASQVRRKNETAATLSQIKFFHRMWIKFVCGRGQPRTSPGGGDPQEGARPPLARPRRAGAPFPPPAGGEIPCP